MSQSRVALTALAMLATCTLAPFGAQAQQPSSTAPTIKFIITHPAGGLPDTVARIVGRRMQ
jgi:tripartite-type tricarboxylate transporter receptor subunit TctC